MRLKASAHNVQFGLLHPDQREQLPQSFEDVIFGERCEGPRTSF